MSIDMSLVMETMCTCINMDFFSSADPNVEEEEEEEDIEQED